MVAEWLRASVSNLRRSSHILVRIMPISHLTMHHLPPTVHNRICATPFTLQIDKHGPTCLSHLIKMRHYLMEKRHTSCFTFFFHMFFWLQIIPGLLLLCQNLTRSLKIQQLLTLSFVVGQNKFQFGFLCIQSQQKLILEAFQWMNHFQKMNML